MRAIDVALSLPLQSSLMSKTYLKSGPLQWRRIKSDCLPLRLQRSWYLRPVA
jgi:hypothetical protein